MVNYRLDRTPLLVEAAGHKAKNLHIFDMDGTMMLSPEPKWGKDWYRYHTMSHTNPRGKNWDHEHEGWWSNPHSLHGPKDAPFPIKPIEHTMKGYHAAKKDPHGRVVIMTGRVNKPEMRHAVTHALKKIGVHGHKHGHDLFLKPPAKSNEKVTATHHWKAEMLHKFHKEHPHLQHVHMWDDRHDHVKHFAKTLDALGVKHTVRHVQHPDWGADMPSHT